MNWNQQNEGIQSEAHCYRVGFNMGLMTKSAIGKWKMKYVGFEGAGKSKRAMNFRMKNLPRKCWGWGEGC